MKPKKSVIIIVSVFAFLLIVLGAGIFIARPKHVYAEYTVCSENGDTKEVVLDVTIYKKWFANKKLLGFRKMTGKITFDGTEYVDPYGEYNKRFNLWTEGGWITFVIPGTDLMDIKQRRLYVWIKNDKLEYIMLTEDNPEEQEQYSYYGPADTVEKQKEILNDVVNGDPWLY